jgi:hypothetical protein
MYVAIVDCYEITFLHRVSIFNPFFYKFSQNILSLIIITNPTSAIQPSILDGWTRSRQFRESFVPCKTKKERKKDVKAYFKKINKDKRFSFYPYELLSCSVRIEMEAI